MPVVTDNLRDAQAVANFSNLEKGDVDNFRNNFPDVAPGEWWSYKPTHLNPDVAITNPELQWRRVQQMLRQAWRRGFPLDITIKLITSVFRPDSVGDAALFGTTDNRPTFAQWHEMPSEKGYYPFQKGIVYLHKQPWRARFCRECRKRFVAVESKNVYCSDACSNESRLRQKREWFNKTGSKRRAARNKNKKKRMKAYPKARPNHRPSSQF